MARTKKEVIPDLPRGTSVQVAGRGPCLYLRPLRGVKKSLVEVILDNGSGKLKAVPEPDVTIPAGFKI